MKGYMYRVWMRLIHHYGYHYAPPGPMPEGAQVKRGIDGKIVYERLHWCQWCGLRGTTIDLRPLNK